LILIKTFKKKLTGKTFKCIKGVWFYKNNNSRESHAKLMQHIVFLYNSFYKHTHFLSIMIFFSSIFFFGQIA